MAFGDTSRAFAASENRAVAARNAMAVQAGQQRQRLAHLKKSEALYAPGGAMTQAAEARVGKARKRSLASGMQSLMSSGLSNTTMAAGLGKTFEEEVGVPAMLGAEADRTGRLAGVYGQMSGAVNQSSGYYPPTPQQAPQRATSGYMNGRAKRPAGSAAGMHSQMRFVQPFGRQVG